jgi:hypothetical protein
VNLIKDRSFDANIWLITFFWILIEQLFGNKLFDEEKCGNLAMAGMFSIFELSDPI